MRVRFIAWRVRRCVMRGRLVLWESNSIDEARLLTYLDIRLLVRIETQMEIFSCAIATPDSLADRVGWKIASLMLAYIRKAIQIGSDQFSERDIVWLHACQA